MSKSQDAVDCAFDSITDRIASWCGETFENDPNLERNLAVRLIAFLRKEYIGEEQ
jgi:hypothetical protein